MSLLTSSYLSTTPLVRTLPVQAGLNAQGVNFGEGTDERDASGRLGFVNVRAWAYWSMREALDPQRGHELALPPDPELLADLAAPRWSIQSGRIKIESKEDIVKRIGRSPDCGATRRL